MKVSKLYLKLFLTFALTFIGLFSLIMLSFAADVPVVDAIVQTDSSTNSITVSWTAQGDPAGYRIYLKSKDNKSEKICSTKASTYTVDKLESGESYVLSIKPYRKENGKTVFGKLKKITCYTGLDKVTQIKQSKTAETSHKLSWNKVEGADSYIIYYYKESIGKYTLLGSTANTYCTVSKLQPTKTYKYIIKATSNTTDKTVITSEKSDVFYAYTKPATVTGFKVTNESTTGYHLEWDQVSGAQGYKIYKFNEKTGKFTQFKKVQGTSYTVRDLSPAKSDVYKISAYAKLAKEVRYSEQSASLTATTKPEAVKPYVIADNSGNGKIKIGWNNDVAADGYLVYVSDSENGRYFLTSQISNPDTTEYVSSDLTNGVAFYFKIKTYILADNKYIYSANSPAVEAYA